jgi:hypothetical protein
VAYGDDVIRANKNVQLTEFNDFGRVDIAGGPQDNEKTIAVTFDFCPLVANECIFNGEVMEVKFFGYRCQFFRRWAVEPHPAHATVFLHGLKRELQACGGRNANAITVNGIIDQGHGSALRC